jgi:hypothetical protein
MNTYNEAPSLEHLEREYAEQEAAGEPKGEDKKPDRLRLVPPSEMDWRGAQLNLVKGILGFGMMALLYGESGSAKTLIALALALHVALGRDWCGRKVKKGFVAYLAPEGGHSVHLRFHAWCRHHGIDPTDDSLPFRTIPVSIDLCTSNADLTQIIANIKAAEADLGRCVLAVVDTVSRAIAGANENAPDDMGKFVLNCDRLREETGATVLGVHHTMSVYFSSSIWLPPWTQHNRWISAGPGPGGGSVKGGAMLADTARRPTSIGTEFGAFEVRRFGA